MTRVERLGTRSARYRVRYEFTLLSGPRRVGFYDLPSRDLAPQPGQRVTVIYDPDNPRRQRLYPFALVRVSSD
ncbi:MAG: DUF3592 domain-containing protein [Bryobacteraceae bacterium]